MDELAAEHERLVDRAEGLLDRALDADVPEKTGKPELADLAGVAHAAVGDQCGDAPGHAGVGQHVAELARRLVAGGHDEHVTGLRVADGDLQHDVVARGGRRR